MLIFVKQNKNTIKTLEEIKKLAAEFIAISDKYCVNVSCYFDGSDADEDIRAYEMAKAADKNLVDAVNEFYGSRDYEYGLNYELAESFL